MRHFYDLTDNYSMPQISLKSQVPDPQPPHDVTMAILHKLQELEAKLAKVDARHERPTNVHEPPQTFRFPLHISIGIWVLVTLVAVGLLVCLINLAVRTARRD